MPMTQVLELPGKKALMKPLQNLCNKWGQLLLRRMKDRKFQQTNRWYKWKPDGFKTEKDPITTTKTSTNKLNYKMEMIEERANELRDG